MIFIPLHSIITIDLHLIYYCAEALVEFNAILIPVRNLPAYFDAVGFFYQCTMLLSNATPMPCLR